MWKDRTDFIQYGLINLFYPKDNHIHSYSH